jgi:transcriptional regulator CtsR
MDNDISIYDNRESIIEEYVRHIVKKSKEPVEMTAQSLDLTPREVTAVVTSAIGRQSIQNRLRSQAQTPEMINARISYDATSTLGINPLDIIEVGDEFPGGYRLRVDVSPEAWNIVKKIIPSQKSHMPPAIEFLDLTERLKMNKDYATIVHNNSEEKDEKVSQLFDGKIIETKRKPILPAVFPATQTQHQNKPPAIDQEIMDGTNGPI